MKVDLISISVNHLCVRACSSQCAVSKIKRSRPQPSLYLEQRQSNFIAREIEIQDNSQFQYYEFA